MLLLVDQQAAFGMEPLSQPVRTRLIQRSFGEDNLHVAADFIKLGLKYGLYVGLTTMVHGGQTSIDRLRQQRELGLVSSEGDFYLCPVGSLDTMIHPLLLEHLGFTKEEIEAAEKYILFHTLSSDLGRAYSLAYRGPLVSSGAKGYSRRHLSIGDALTILEKPERVLSRDNFEQLVSVGSSDIFVGGADIHLCVAEVVNNLRLSAGKKPNIWIVADLSVTRPKDFETARQALIDLLDPPANIFLVNQVEATRLIERNVNDSYLTLANALIYTSWFNLPAPVHFKLYGNT